MFSRSLGIMVAAGVTAAIGGSSLAAPQAPGARSPLRTAVTALPSPAAEGAAQPNLATDATGRIWLSWLEPAPGGGHRFRLASLSGSAWTAPATIAEGPGLLANWADFPSVFAAADGTLAAHWLERGASPAAYGIRLRTSRDAGRTWSAPQIPHRDRPAAGEHGFVSFFDAPGGGIGLVWLDGRDTAGHMSGGSMALRSTTLTEGALAEDRLVDPRVCDCCQTSAARTASGVVVAYRDRSDAEVRDISVVAFRNGRWTNPVGVHADNWQIHGCPVNGPVVASSGAAVAVAWFTRAGDVPQAKVAFSSDEGATFDRPIPVGGGAALGRLGMVMPDRNRAIVSALEKTEAGARIVLREIARDGRSRDPIVVSAATPDRAGGFARVALAGRRLVVAWTDVRPGAPSRVATAVAEIR